MLNLDTLGLNVIVSATGITAPDFETIRSTLVSYFQEIYGSDSYLDADSKDGQMVSIYALAIHDANNNVTASVLLTISTMRTVCVRPLPSCNCGL